MSAFRQALFELIKRLKNSATSALVWALARGKPCLVNAVVHVVVEEIGELRVLGLDLFREKVDGFISRRVVKHLVEHAADVVLAIVYDTFRFCVPQHRYSRAHGNWDRSLCRLGSKIGSR